MRVLVIGLGIQGKKRVRFCYKDLSATVDPKNPAATYKNIEDVPVNSFDAAIICVPDGEKIKIIRYLLKNNKHILVEKPLWAETKKELNEVSKLLKSKSSLIVRTAYNHRFEPSFLEMKKLIQSQKLGEIYSCRMFYGNGTAQLVKSSPWRDQGSGALLDLGSHLIDTCLFWFGDKIYNFKKTVSNSYENKSPDHVIISSEIPLPRIELEMTFCMWRNHFTCDIIGSKGSAHIESLCKWGEAKFIHRTRVFPAGCPLEKRIEKNIEDPTWELEYKSFLESIDSGEKSNLDKDLWLYDTLKKLEKSIVGT